MKPKFDKKTMIKIITYDPLGKQITRWVCAHYINTSTAATTHNIVDSKTGKHGWVNVAGQTIIELKGTVVK